MSGERRLIRGVLPWSVAGGAVATAISFAIRGAEGALSTLIALGIVLANALAAVAISATASRVSPTAPAMVSLPSFAVRMIAIFAALNVLKTASFLDQPAFALTFGLAVTAMLVLEAANLKRTPWLALTLDKAPIREEKTT